MLTNLSFRQATLEDSAFLLEWRNDPLTKLSSHSIASVSLKEHNSWLNDVLSDSQRQLFIVENNSTAVACVRAELTSGAWRLSWTTAPNHRGRGIAKHSVKTIADNIYDPISAEVKIENTASAKVAEFSGLKLITKNQKTLQFYRGPIEK